VSPAAINVMTLSSYSAVDHWSTSTRMSGYTSLKAATIRFNAALLGLAHEGQAVTVKLPEGPSAAAAGATIAAMRRRPTINRFTLVNLLFDLYWGARSECREAPPRRVE